MIRVIGTALYQWDTGRSVSITDIEADKVHFANKGDSKAVIMDISNSQAKIPDYLLQTGKQLCVYVVKNGSTVETKTFSVSLRERPENYVYEDDQRNYIYELIQSAEVATEAATLATESANNAAQNASASAGNATSAASAANQAAEDAHKASDNANEAATKAAHTAKSLMVVGKADGTNIYLDDAIDQFVVGGKIFGKTTQNGTPTPDAPVDLVSVGDSGSIMVNVTGYNDANSATIATPNGLPGIPVASGGNYTDANGQQWVCDEIDFSLGVYTQRCFMETVAVTFDEAYDRYTGKLKRYANTLFTTDQGISVVCNKLSFNGLTASGVNGVRVSIFNPNTLVAYYNGEDPGALDVLYPLATPIETPLSREQIAAFNALHTYRGNTTASNDASAHMEIEYAMDAKKYIDKVIGTGGVALPWLTWVSLPASKWVGSDSLYSQVVTINGVTPNSKVDLLPSVEQLAIFHNKDVAFVTENEDGVVTVYAIGDKPLLDYNIQAQITEVAV